MPPGQGYTQDLTAFLRALSHEYSKPVTQIINHEVNFGEELFLHLPSYLTYGIEFMEHPMTPHAFQGQTQICRVIVPRTKSKGQADIVCVLWVTQCNTPLRN